MICTAVEPVMSCAQLREIQAQVRNVAVEESLAGYLIDIVQATRNLLVEKPDLKTTAQRAFTSLNRCVIPP